MAARRPVVSSAIGGTDELIDDGADGLLVAPGDAAALASGAAAPARRPRAARSALRQRARERVERDFTPAAMARRVEAIYEELLADD